MTILASGNKKMILISNRFPGDFRRDGSGRKPTVSGLVSAVEPVLEATRGIWVAWGGRMAPGGTANPPPQSAVDRAYSFQEVFLSEGEYQDYYLGLSNQCLWPISHCLVESSRFSARQWEAYRKVNEKFARAAVQARDEGAYFWVHDYHLSLVPQLLREAQKQAKIAFFWHIPFPPYDIFRVVPWHEEILTGMLGANLVGFHTPGYVKNFLECVAASTDAEVDFNRGQVEYHGRLVNVRALPVGVDWEYFTGLAESPSVRARAAAIRQALGTQRLLLGVDRLDYTKGILERLAAFESFLAQNPALQGEVTLLQIGIPSRENIPAYRKLRSAVEAAVGRINGQYDRGYEAVPVRYVSHPLDPEELAAHYLAADVALITPVRDGLNLVAKEFAACRNDGTGVLVLSAMAGAAEDMPGALVVNPYDTLGLAAAIDRSLTMPASEQRGRMYSLRRSVQKHDVTWWWHATLKHLTSADIRSQAALPARAETAVRN